MNLRRVVIAFALALVVAALPAGGARALAADKKQRARAEKALREGEFASAEKLYRELVEKDPKDAAARLGLSYAQLKQRNLRDAYDNAARVVAVDPLSARAHALLGSALLSAGDFALSVEEFRTALGLDPAEALAVAGLSMINFYENRTQVALEGLRRAVELDPNEPDFLYSYAQTASRAERYREAADGYEQFLRIAPKTDADRRARIRGLIDFLRYIGNQGALYQVGGPARTETPFELVNSRPIFTVRVNGAKRPLRFVLDTGSGMCVVAREAAERIGLKPIARGGMARAVGGGGRFEIVYGFIETLQLGETKISNVPVYLRDFYSSQEPVDGYIGLSVLSRFLSTVDYGTRAMSLLRDDARTDAPQPDAVQPPPGAVQTAGAPEPAFAFELPIRSTSSGFWSGSVRVADMEKPANFIIDTGATVSVVSEEYAARESLSRYEQQAKLRVYGAAGVSEGVRLLMLPRLTLGSYVHPNLAAAVLDMSSINETAGFEQTGIVGGNVLRFFRLTFDFRRGAVRFEMIPNFKPSPLPREANVTPQGY
jgi:tetratricopeptide (TPR) repeat protein